MLTAIFQSTLSVRRATYAATHDLFVVAISIHALREESDYKMGANKQTTTFQSTLSVRRATIFECQIGRHLSDFNPLSP